MPSWSASDVQKEQADTPPATADATDIDAARKLLDELFSELPADKRPPSAGEVDRMQPRVSPGSSREAPVSHPELAPELVRALNDTDCLAARTALDTVEVFAPWLSRAATPAHAGTELLFFVKAWASRHPQFRATLLDPR